MKFRELAMINSGWDDSTILEILVGDVTVKVTRYDAEDMFGDQKVYCFNGNMVILDSWVGGGKR